MLPEAATPAVILGEALAKAALRGLDIAQVDQGWRRAGLQVSPTTAEGALEAARLWPLARRNVSLADRFCIAFAARRGYALVTADRPWRDLDLGVELRLIR